MFNPDPPPAAPVAIEPFNVGRIEAFVLRWPVSQPVKTSFGTMLDRPAVLVRVEERDGAIGWGEIWCNFPACGAEHRQRLLETLVAPLIVDQVFERAESVFDLLTAKTAVLAIQCGEPGPIAQVIAGVDLAIWDMLARRAGLPLWQLLGGRSGSVKVYASGINPDRPQDTVAAKLAEGYRAFKLKIGFGEERDLANLREVRAMLAADASVMLDANQAWDLATALRTIGPLMALAPAWLEEPLRADRPIAEWQQLAQATRVSGVPLAGGENLIGADVFAAMIDAHVLGVVQPDLAKWGGVSGCLPVIEHIHRAGQRYCPHFLGAGIGLLASAHVLAARGRVDGMLEIDANTNPLRTELSPALNTIVNGMADLGVAPGLGVEPDLGRLRELCDAAKPRSAD